MHNYYGPCRVIGCLTCWQMKQAINTRIKLKPPDTMTVEELRKFIPLNKAR